MDIEMGGKARRTLLQALGVQRPWGESHHGIPVVATIQPQLPGGGYG